MLTTLRVGELAIAREVHLDLEPGLTVLSGETGAGKSILVDAVALLLGTRGSSDLVRAGARAARVEGIFRVADNPSALKALAGLGLDPEEDEVILGREISAQGRGKVYINGALNTLDHLKQLGATLVDIHGQHEHIRMLDPRRHVDVLDAFADSLSLREEVATAWDQVQEFERRRRQLDTDERERAQRVDILAFQVREIEQAAPEPGEDESLERERLVQDNAERVLELAQGSYLEVYEQERSVLGRLAELEQRLSELSAYEPRFEQARKQCEASRFELEDVAFALRDYAQEVNFDPERQAALVERLELLNRLKTKYGATLEAVIEFSDRAREELQTLLSVDQQKHETEQALEQARVQYAELALKLSRRRKKAVPKLSQAVETELHALAMERARFVVRLTQAEEPGGSALVQGRPVAGGRHGVDKVEFLLTANPGEPPRPLISIVSGGELARLQLAVLSVVRGEGAAPTAVYDEVDAGVSGRVGDAVGRRLRALARGRQVLCVTHLAQVAAHADHTLQVVKRTRKGRAEVEARPLTGSDRIEELARMLGGAGVTAAARRHAEELLAQASAAR